jgi:hypothetical protein
MAREELKRQKYTYPVFEMKKNEAFEIMLNEGVPISEIVRRGGLFKRWFSQGFFSYSTISGCMLTVLLLPYSKKIPGGYLYL